MHIRHKNQDLVTHFNKRLMLLKSFTQSILHITRSLRGIYISFILYLITKSTLKKFKVNGFSFYLSVCLIFDLIFIYIECQSSKMKLAL